MLVLHGFWSMSGGLRLWAEDSDLLVKSPSQALRSARPHPFAAAADAIAQITSGQARYLRAAVAVVAVGAAGLAGADPGHPAPGRTNRRHAVGVERPGRATGRRRGDEGHQVRRPDDADGAGKTSGVKVAPTSAA